MYLPAESCSIHQRKNIRCPVIAKWNHVSRVLTWTKLQYNNEKITRGSLNAKEIWTVFLKLLCTTTTCHPSIRTTLMFNVAYTHPTAHKLHGGEDTCIICRGNTHPMFHVRSAKFQENRYLKNQEMEMNRLSYFRRHEIQNDSSHNESGKQYTWLDCLLSTKTIP